MASASSPPTSKDVFAHVLRVVARTPPRPAPRWGGLLHDIAKPRTRSVEAGHVHFFGHEDVGAVMAREILRRLDSTARSSSSSRRSSGCICASTPTCRSGPTAPCGRLMLDAGDALPDLLDLLRADITSYRPDKVAAPSRASTSWKRAAPGCARRPSASPEESAGRQRPDGALWAWSQAPGCASSRIVCLAW